MYGVFGLRVWVLAGGLGLVISGFVVIVIVAFSCWVLGCVRFVWYFRLLRVLFLVCDFGVCGFAGFVDFGVLYIVGFLW